MGLGGDGPGFLAGDGFSWIITKVASSHKKQILDDCLLAITFFIDSINIVII